MNGKKIQLCFVLFVLLITLSLITGCVEVAPPSGEQNASAYGPANTGGSMKDLVKDQGQQGSNVNQGSEGQSSSSQTTNNQTEPTIPAPPTPNESFVQVTPKKNYEELDQGAPVSYLPYNRPVSTNDTQYVTIHYISNQSFSKNASAYAYELVTPPLFIDLGFYPKMITDELEVYKRTGDKEGTITYSKTHPSRDSWFEMRVYDLSTGQEILREGYGKTYSLTNKTAAIRRAGKFQFDFMGDAIAVDIAMKIPVNSSTISMYSNVSSLIEDQKVKSGLLPRVFIEGSELGSGWQQTGDVVHTPTHYSSIYTMPSSGSKIIQDITKYSQGQDTNTAYLETKKTNAGETQISVLAGDEGYGFESVRKTGVTFRQGSYLVQLTSYSIPPVSLDSLKRYATIISGKISNN